MQGTGTTVPPGTGIPTGGAILRIPVPCIPQSLQNRMLNLASGRKIVWKGIILLFVTSLHAGLVAFPFPNCLSQTCIFHQFIVSTAFYATRRIGRQKTQKFIHSVARLSPRVAHVFTNIPIHYRNF